MHDTSPVRERTEEHYTFGSRRELHCCSRHRSEAKACATPKNLHGRRADLWHGCLAPRKAAHASWRNCTSEARRHHRPRVPQAAHSCVRWATHLLGHHRDRSSTTGQGVRGGALLRAINRVADSEGLPAYLETGENNRSLYEHFGYEVVGQTQLDGGHRSDEEGEWPPCPLLGMLRQPVKSASASSLVETTPST